MKQVMNNKREISAKYQYFFEFINKSYCDDEGNGRYYIPSIQRQYIWKPRLYEGLLERFLKAKKTLEKIDTTSKKIFLGHILLYKDNKENDNLIKIIDGQQRIVTITLILCVLNFMLNKYTKIINTSPNQKENLIKLKEAYFDLDEKLKKTSRGTIDLGEINSYKNIKDLVLKWVNFFIRGDSKEGFQRNPMLLTLKNSVLENYILNYYNSEKNSEKNEVKIHMLNTFQKMINLMHKDFFSYLIDKLNLKKKTIKSYDDFISNEIKKKEREEEFTFYLLSYIMDFLKVIATVSFIVTIVHHTKNIDSEYSLFINLNARRQNLAPFDLIRGFIMSKLDEQNLPSEKINLFGSKLDEELFNIVFIERTDIEEENIKRIFHDIDFSDLSNKDLINNLVEEFKEWKKVFVQGSLEDSNNWKNCKLSLFFLMFYSYYNLKAFDNYRIKLIDLAYDWVEKEKPNSKSIMEEISEIIKNSIPDEYTLWKWNKKMVFVDFENWYEKDNMLRLFYAYIKTFSKWYFYSVFKITNRFDLEFLTQKEKNYFRPIIMRVILSVLDDSLKIDKTKIKDAKQVLKLLIVFFSLQKVTFTNYPKFTGICEDLHPEKKSMNKYGFWEIDLKKYALELKKRISLQIENEDLEKLFKGEKDNVDSKVRSRIFKFVLSRHFSHQKNSPNDGQTYDLITFIPFSINETRDLIYKTEDDNRINTNLDIRKLGMFKTTQIGNYFYIESSKTDKNPSIFNIYKNIKEYLEEDKWKSTKDFHNTICNFLETTNEYKEFDISVFNDRSTSMWEEFKIWIKGIISDEENIGDFESISTLVWGEVQSGKTLWICKKLLYFSDLEKKRINLTLFLVGNTNDLYHQAKERVIAFYGDDTNDWNKDIEKSTKNLTVFRKNNNYVVIIHNLDFYKTNEYKTLIDNYNTAHIIYLSLKEKTWLEKLREELISYLGSFDYVMMDDECDYFSLSSEKELGKTINDEIHRILNHKKIKNKYKYSISATPFVNEEINTKLDEVIVMKNKDHYWNHFRFLSDRKMASCFKIQRIKPKNDNKTWKSIVVEIVNSFLKRNYNKPKMQLLINPGQFVTNRKESNSIDEIYKVIKENVKYNNTIKLVQDTSDFKNIWSDIEPTIIIGGKKTSRGLTFEFLREMFLDSFSSKTSTKNFNISNVLQKARWCGYSNDYKDYSELKIHISREDFFKYVLSATIESWKRFLVVQNSKENKEEFVMKKSNIGEGFKKLISINKDIKWSDIKDYDKGVNNYLDTYKVFYNPIEFDYLDKWFSWQRNSDILESNSLIGIRFLKGFVRENYPKRELVCTIINPNNFINELSRFTNKVSKKIVSYPLLHFDKEKSVFVRSKDNALIKLSLR